MFIVAPRGRVKLAIFFDTLARLVIQSRVTGKVAEDDAVEKAVSRAGERALKWLTKFKLAKIFSINGSTTKLCIPNPSRTVRAKVPIT